MNPDQLTIEMLNPSRSVLRVLEVTGLDRLFKIEDTATSAGAA